MTENSEGLFYQVFLRKWHPQPTIPCAMVIFSLVGFFFFILGIVITAYNSKIIEVKISHYDTLGDCAKLSDCSANQPCYL